MKKKSLKLTNLSKLELNSSDMKEITGGVQQAVASCYTSWASYGRPDSYGGESVCHNFWAGSASMGELFTYNRYVTSALGL